MASSRALPGSIPRAQIEVVFAPTGPMQELSLSSGGAEWCVALAEPFDEYQ